MTEQPSRQRIQRVYSIAMQGIISALPSTVSTVRINRLPNLEDVPAEWVEFDRRRYAKEFARLESFNHDDAVPLFVALYEADAVRSTGIEMKGLALIQMQALLVAVLAFVWTDTAGGPLLISFSILTVVHLLFACYASLQLAETRSRFVIRADEFTSTAAEVLGLLKAVVEANSRVAIRLSNLAASAKQDTWRALVFTVITASIDAV